MNPYRIENPMVTDEDVQDHQSIAAVLHKDDFILLFKHIKYDWWTLPIGKVKLGDTPEKTLIDEMKEELGVEVEKFTKLGDFSKTYDRGHGIVTNIRCHIFDIESFVGEPTNLELDKHQWMIWSLYPNAVNALPSLSDATKFYLDNFVK